jgi:hypothetical protein
LKTAGKTTTGELIHTHFYGVDKGTKTLLEVLTVSDGLHTFRNGEDPYGWSPFGR